MYKDSWYVQILTFIINNKYPDFLSVSNIVSGPELRLLGETRLASFHEPDARHFIPAGFTLTPGRAAGIE